MKARRSLYKQKLMKLCVYQQVEVCVCSASQLFYICYSVLISIMSFIVNTHLLDCNANTPPPVVITTVLSYYEHNIIFHGRDSVMMLSCQTLPNRSHIFLVETWKQANITFFKHHAFMLTAVQVTLWECCIRSSNYLCISNIIFFVYCILWVLKYCFCVHQL